MAIPANDDRTVSIPLSQYVDCIVAFQKLDDIRRVVFSEDLECLEYDDYAIAILLAVKAIVSVNKKSDSCLVVKGAEDK